MTRTPATPLVLLYHSVSPEADDPFEVTVGPRRFAEQMAWLHRRGLRGTSVGELLAAHARGGSASRGLVGLTFDDGYVDVLRHALPVLAGHGFSATVFALSGRLGGWNAWDSGGPRKPLMTAHQLREAASAGIEIGSHGSRHVRLPTVGPDALDEEIRGSRERLQAITGQPVGGFCYPWGVTSRQVVDRVRAAGYDYACAVWHTGLPDPYAAYALPRTYLHDGDHGWRLDAKRWRHRLTCRGRLGLLRPRPAFAVDLTHAAKASPP